ncbi:hypothetical protein CHU98_g11120, partial [Xylaria longipes]
VSEEAETKKKTKTKKQSQKGAVEGDATVEMDDISSTSRSHEFVAASEPVYRQQRGLVQGGVSFITACYITPKVGPTVVGLGHCFTSRPSTLDRASSVGQCPPIVDGNQEPISVMTVMNYAGTPSEWCWEVRRRSDALFPVH